jgi:hypothetical protein
MYTCLQRATGAIYLPRVNRVLSGLLSLAKLITSKGIPVSPRLAVRLGRHGNDGEVRPRDTFCRKLAYCLPVCVLAISNRCLKDGSCAHKGLITNCPHHSSTHSSACAPNFPAVLCRCSSRRRGSRTHNHMIYLVGGDNISKYSFIFVSSFKGIERKRKKR